MFIAEGENGLDKWMLLNL